MVNSTDFGVSVFLLSPRLDGVVGDSEVLGDGDAIVPPSPSTVRGDSVDRRSDPVPALANSTSLFSVWDEPASA